jgi:hypothetical protein
MAFAPNCKRAVVNPPRSSGSKWPGRPDAGSKSWSTRLTKNGGASQPSTPAKNTSKFRLGNDGTKKSTKYTVVAMTTEKPLTKQTYLNLPDYRTKSRTSRRSGADRTASLAATPGARVRRFEGDEL